MPILSKASKDEFDSPMERLLSSIANLRQQPTSKGAHFYRTSLRRFQAWSDVFHPQLDPGQKQALKFLDKLRKITGKLRDSSVHLDLLDTIVGVGAADKKKLKKSLKTRRNAHEKKLRALLQDPLLNGIWRSLRVVDEYPGTLAEPANAIAGASTLALNEYRAFVQRRGTLSAKNLHEYRLECKRFRYTAELAGDTPEAKDPTEIWKQVQDVIGEWHDYLTLSEIAAKTVTGSSLHSALVGLTDKTYKESLRVVEQAERQLAGESEVVPKKEPGGGARSSRRAARIA